MIMIMVYYDVIYKLHLQSTIITATTIYIYNIIDLTLSDGFALFKKIASAVTGSENIRSI